MSKAADNAKAPETENANESPQEQGRKDRKKSRWTLDLCQKAARRFKTLDEWSIGAPSSYKAACSRGWDAECSKHMKSVSRSKTA